MILPTNQRPVLPTNIQPYYAASRVLLLRLSHGIVKAGD